MFKHVRAHMVMISGLYRLFWRKARRRILIGEVNHTSFFFLYFVKSINGVLDR